MLRNRHLLILHPAPAVSNEFSTAVGNGFFHQPNCQRCADTWLVKSQPPAGMFNLVNGMWAILAVIVCHHPCIVFFSVRSWLRVPHRIRGSGREGSLHIFELLRYPILAKLEACLLQMSIHLVLVTFVIGIQGCHPVIVGQLSPLSPDLRLSLASPPACRRRSLALWDFLC
jgi:hypothetical protein